MAKLNISPGCRLCHSGSWLCVYITRKCNRDCFFCSQEKLKEGKGSKTADNIRAYVSEEIQFEDVEEVVGYLKYWKIKGLGISGGEPLLVLDKVCRLISLAKEEIPGIYAWVYTNGDLITAQNLMRLKRAGLDELRFDLVARDYELTPLRLAAGIIKNVTVEIPTIPKDKEKLISLISELRKMGVMYLNLHELMVTKENRSKLAKARISGAGSLDVARGIEAASKKLRSGLGVNVCPLSYKKTEQTRNMIGHMRKVSGLANK